MYRHPDAVFGASVRMVIHFFVNFDVFEWLYLSLINTKLGEFCESRCALSDYVDQ